jgi:hypothetical protein
MSSAMVPADGDTSSGIAHQPRRDPKERAKERERNEKGKVPAKREEARAMRSRVLARAEHVQSANSCRTPHPDHLPWKKTGTMECEGEGETNRETGQLEVLDPHGRNDHKCIDAKVEKGIDTNMGNASMQECGEYIGTHMKASTQIWKTHRRTRRS